MKKSKVIALSGVLSALSIVLIFIGTIFSIFAYVVPIVAGLVLISAVCSINKKSAWLIYVTVSIVTLLLMPDKECPLTYIFFFGYYPIIKYRLNLIGGKLLTIVAKFSIFNAGIITSQLICFYVFGIPFDDFLGKWGIVLLLFLANVVFVLYDRMLIFVEILYMKRLHNKILNILK